MKIAHKSKFITISETVLRMGVLFCLALTIILMSIALVDRNNDQEAYLGSFEDKEFNKGWTLIQNNQTQKVELPVDLNFKQSDEVVIVNTLPDDLSDGMSMMMRATMEDIIIYIDDVERSEYSSESIDGMSYYLPSAYVIADLNSEDAGKEVRILIRFKESGVINEVEMGHGNNVWFSAIKSGLPVAVFALIVLVMGTLLFAAAIWMRNSFKVDAARYLGLLMIDVALWIISESSLRQLIFRRPSLTQYFSYFLVELIGIIACMFFDEVQHRTHHTSYVLAESLVFYQLIINVLLHVFNVADLYETMMISHIWSGLCAVVAIVNIIKDTRSKLLNQYSITAIGMICFVVMSLSELVGFYVDRFHVFGASTCIAMVFLMSATIIQTVYDEITEYELREKRRTAMTINTIETIASAMDARDEYTGGHSERVGLYAGRLAREMAADYDLTEEDILRVHYIGLVHDIGKIGVADSVLNKSGRLNDEEFTLMKKHTEIGYEMMSALGDEIPGLLDGIRYHHEKFDGSGYPDGLSYTDIPLIARVLSLADSYDAMTSNRIYRNRLTDEEVRQQLLSQAGTQFDPALTELFVRLLDRNELRAMTVSGMATDDSGNLRYSSILENKLQTALLNKEEVQNPAHVRMLCYLMKLMERKGKAYSVLFAESKENIRDLRKGAHYTIQAHDVIIRYTKTQEIIALYDRNDSQVEEYKGKLKNYCPDVVIWELEGNVASVTS